MIASPILDLREIDLAQVAVVGGKAARLGELSRIPGVVVPSGFCVTTDAFREAVEGVPSIADRIEALSGVSHEDLESIGVLAADLRSAIEGVALSDDLTAAISSAVGRLGDDSAFAVRSSATAEDLVTASFAGLQDTYLNVVGTDAVLAHLRRCWASLFTDRATIYRARNGVDHRQAHMAVVVQRMVDAEAAGVLFTADPVSSNRKVVIIEAVAGLGDALVAGRVNPDVYRERDGQIVDTRVATEGAGPVLADTQVLSIANLGRQIEAHFGCPQDVEWCLSGGEFQVVQSRPITTLFPIPAAGDGANHVYVSVGHQQMMTDPMKPLGLSIWQLTALRPMYEAGGRLFVDVTEELASPTGRARLLDLAGRTDPLMKDALATVMEGGGPISTPAAPAPADAADPAIVADLVGRAQASLAALRRDIRTKAGDELLAFIQADIQELQRLLLDPLSFRALMAGMEAAWWLNDQLDEWLGERNVADALSQSAPGNVTAEMGLALLDVADAIRPHPEVVAFLHDVVDDGFREVLQELPGGVEAGAAIEEYLDRYGMRCVGEIDITRPRWSERPSTLVPLILSNIKGFPPGERERRFEGGRARAAAKEAEVLERLRTLPDGEAKAAEAKRMIDQLRGFVGYREYPKYVIVGRYFAYKEALLREADRLVDARVMSERAAIFFLRFDELGQAVRTGVVDEQVIRSRREAFRSYQALSPPRVLTSDGEAVSGRHHRDDQPAGALVGVAVSAGRVEGRARVISDLAQADLEAGDILVTAYTDPSWSPLFVAVAGLVTEAGGLMTHGSVIAREYGLPAVVGVEHATRLIQDGQWIRVDGGRGYVEILP